MTGRNISSTLSTVLVAIATVVLTACGPDNAALGNDAQTATPGGAAQSGPTPALQAAGAPDSPGAASGLSRFAAAGLSDPANPANPASGAMSDAAVTSVQASLAADNRQIAPVMRYAPGDDSQ